MSEARCISVCSSSVCVGAFSLSLSGEGEASWFWKICAATSTSDMPDHSLTVSVSPISTLASCPHTSTVAPDGPAGMRTLWVRT